MNEKSLVKNILRYCIPTVISALISITVIPLISRLYAADEYGKIELFYTVGNMVYTLCLLGLDQAYIRFFDEPPIGAKRNSMFVYALVTGIAVDGVLTVATLLFFRKELSVYLFGEINIGLLLTLAIYIIALMVFRLCSLTARMKQDAKLFNIQQVSLIVCTRLLFLCAVPFSRKYQAGVLVMAGATLAFALFYFLRLCKTEHVTMQLPKNSACRELMRYAIPLMPAAMMVWLNDASAKMLLRGLGSFSDVGIFAMGTRISNLFSIVSSAFGVYWSTFMYKYYNTQRELIRRVHDYVTILSIVIVVMVVAFQDIIFVLAGEEYRVSQSFFMLLMINPIQLFLAETTGYGIQLAKKTKYSLLISSMACATNVIVCLILIPHFGMIGAAIGTCTSALVLLGLNTAIGQHFYRSIRSVPRTLIAWISMFALCVADVFMYENLPLRIILCMSELLVCAILYRKTFVQMVREISSMLKKRIRNNINGDHL